MKNNASLSNQTTFRENVIAFVYQREVLQKNLDPFGDEYNFTNQEINAIDWIIKKYDFIKKMIVPHLNPSWKWERITPLERAILIFATWEMNVRPKKVVINEAINYAKKYIVELKHAKFINAVLDKVGKDYEKTRD